MEAAIATRRRSGTRAGGEQRSRELFHLTLPPFYRYDACLLVSTRSGLPVFQLSQRRRVGPGASAHRLIIRAPGGSTPSAFMSSRTHRPLTGSANLCRSGSLQATYKSSFSKRTDRSSTFRRKISIAFPYPDPGSRRSVTRFTGKPVSRMPLSTEGQGLLDFLLGRCQKDYGLPFSTA